MNLVFALSFIFTVIQGGFLLQHLKQRKIKQIIREDGPQTHLKKKGTPTMGGLMCIITTIIFSIVIVVLSLFGKNIIYGNFDKNLFISISVLSILFGLIGFLDDYLKVELSNTDGLLPRYKMLLLAIVSIIFLIINHFWLRLPSVVIILSKTIALSTLVVSVLNILVLLSTTNAINLTDGLDGLASIVGIIIMTFLATSAIKFGNMAIAIYLSIVIGAFLGFLLYNFYKAKIFMGDVGSFFLGSVIALSAIYLNIQLYLPLIAIIPVLEAVSVIIQVLYYKKTKKRFFKMAPLHHHFEKSGWKELKVVTVFSIITFIACILAKMLI